MKKLCLDRKYTLDQLADEISSAKYYVPKGKEFEEGEWIDLTKEQRILLYSMGIKEMDDYFPGTGHDSQLEQLRWAGLKPKRGRKKKDEI